MRFKLSIFTVLAATFLVSTMATAAEEPSEQVKRMDAAATELDEIMGTPDKGIPEELLNSAKCVAVIPSMIKIGFVFGGRQGRGLATCRTHNSQRRTMAAGDARVRQPGVLWAWAKPGGR